MPERIYDPRAWGRIPKYGMDMQARASRSEVTCGPLLIDFMFRLQKGETLLDVACGAGTNAFFIEEERIPVSYTGIDITPCYLDLARKRFPQHAWVEGDARALPFPDQSFDHTFCINLILHLELADVPRVLSEMARVTRKAIYIQSRFAEADAVEVANSTYPESSGKASAFYYNTTSTSLLDLPGWEWYRVADRMRRLNASNWPYKSIAYDPRLLDFIFFYLAGREGEYVVLERKQ